MRSLALAVLWVIPVSSLALAGCAQAAEPTHLNAPTPAQAASAADALQAGMDRFERELRGALARHDAAAMALLVRFPLRINHPDFSITTLDNPRALENGFDQAFPPELRETVLRSSRDQLVGLDEMSFANGLLWASRIGEGETGSWRLRTVNLPRSSFDPKKPAPMGLEFTCETAKLRIVVESDSHSAAVLPPRIRFRAWDKPHFPPDPPDMQISEGVWDIRGTGRCSAQVFSFIQGQTRYELSEIGCSSGEDVPGDRTGKIEIYLGDQPQAHAWCF
ncbi:MAG: hypothetical protein HYV63_29250 [Candidatus Schekmanbacteria bacterium]|nr:hypothetical protein [Candidatus Schekmanbacteria bacterium]